MPNLLRNRTSRLAAAIVAAVSLALAVGAETFRAETNTPESTPFANMAPFTSIISKYTDHEIEVAAGIVTTKSMVEIGRGNIDFTNAAFSPFAAMQNQKGICPSSEVLVPEAA